MKLEAQRKANAMAALLRPEVRFDIHALENDDEALRQHHLDQHFNLGFRQRVWQRISFTMASIYLYSLDTACARSSQVDMCLLAYIVWHLYLKTHVEQQ